MSVNGASGQPQSHFDAASGERLHPAAREALLAALDQGWADPARLYREARRARAAARHGARERRVAAGRAAGRDVVHGVGDAGRAPRAAGPRRRHARGAARPAERRRALVGAARGRPPVPGPGRARWCGCRWTAPGGSTPGRTPTGSPVRTGSRRWPPCRRPTTRSARCSRWARSPRPAPAPAPRCWSTPRRRSAGCPCPAGWSVLTASAHKWGGPAGGRGAGRAQGGALAGAVARRRAGGRAGARLRERTRRGGGRRRAGGRRAGVRHRGPPALGTGRAGADGGAAAGAGRPGRRQPRRCGCRTW